ncbi:MAG: TMEM165/GDT1 family protein [Casimicrobiaceae bacterium]
MLSAFLVSLGVVAVGEIGDKTQLLSLLLAARYRRPWPIVAGILTATLFNHTLAGLVGALLRHHLDPQVLRWLVATAFLVVAIWTLKPDRLDDDAATKSHFNVFVVTAVAFFLAEMGDKTQIATALLAARYDSLVAVVAGTTLGMLVADVPVVLLGNVAAHRIPFRALRIVAAILFASLGVWAFFAPAPV